MSLENLRIESLRIFRDVIRLASFSRAARANDVSQSAASQSVQHLEKALGVELVNRSCRPLRPTEQGRLFYEGCAPILERFDALTRRVRSTEAGLRGSLGLATIYSVGLHGIQTLLERFRTLHENVRVKHIVGGGKKVAEAVKTARADLGILAYPRETRTLGLHPLPHQPLVLACAPDHPLARHPGRPVSREELEGVRLVAYESGLSIRRAVDRFLREHGVKVRVRMEIDNTETIKQALRSTGGVSILPEPNLRAEGRLGLLVRRPLGFGELVRPMGVLFRRDRSASEVVEAFLGLLDQEPQPWGL